MTDGLLLRRTLISVAGVMLLTCSASFPAAAQEDFWARMKLDFHRNNCWPEPFVHADRQVTRGVFGAMVQKGWQRQMTLGDHHFSPRDQHLTESGRMHLEWIVREAPVQRRQVFVFMAGSEAATRQRLEAVRQAADQIAAGGPPPGVSLTNVAPPLSEGAYYDDVYRKVQTTIPDPRLPPMTGIDTGDGG